MESRRRAGKIDGPNFVASQMPVVFDITHRTTYRYAEAVVLGAHRILFRPRDSHDLRVLATDLAITPSAVDVRMVMDAYSNSVAIVQPSSPSSEFGIVCRFTVEHTGSRGLDLPIEPGREAYPVSYSDEDRIVLQPFLQPFYDDPMAKLSEWARQFVETDGVIGVRDPLVAMNAFIRRTMAYQVRNEEGVQTPYETIERQSGSCRDFATLMIEASRALGYAARFVSGYIHVPQSGEGSAITAVAGATHAWVQVYLPGAGWIAFDPTNNLIGGFDLIRVAVARHASQASPVSGTWEGRPGDYLGMTVEVTVAKR